MGRGWQESSSVGPGTRSRAPSAASPTASSPFRATRQRTIAASRIRGLPLAIQRPSLQLHAVNSGRRVQLGQQRSSGDHCSCLRAGTQNVTIKQKHRHRGTALPTNPSQPDGSVQLGRQDLKWELALFVSHVADTTWQVSRQFLAVHRQCYGLVLEAQECALPALQVCKRWQFRAPSNCLSPCRDRSEVA